MSVVEALEEQLDGFRKLMERQDMANRLYENPDFRKLILEEFMVKEAAAYVHTSGDPNMDATQRADVLAIAQAGGHLKRWLSVCNQMGNTARNQIADLEDQIALARAEELEDQ